MDNRRRVGIGTRMFLFANFSQWLVAYTWNARISAMTPNNTPHRDAGHEDGALHIIAARARGRGR